MSKMMSLKDLKIDILSGQIMSRVTIKPGSDEEIIESRKVIIPKAVLSDGTIDVSVLPTENLKTPADKKRLTQINDIVIKLSSPYDAAIIDEQSADCLVPSFCAIIKSSDDVDVNYLLAFLNSNFCKEQLKVNVAGSIMTVLSVGKVASVQMPVPEKKEQVEIGMSYRKTQKKLSIIREIAALEAKRNDVIFNEMVKDYE